MKTEWEDYTCVYAYFNDDDIPFMISRELKQEWSDAIENWRKRHDKQYDILKKIVPAKTRYQP